MENTYLQTGPNGIGKVNIKALYREYTDATFTTLKPRDAKWQHLGQMRVTTAASLVAGGLPGKLPAPQQSAEPVHRQ